MKYFLLLLSLLLCLNAISAPSEERTWNSTSGTTLRASAVDFKDGQVKLKTNDGRIIKVPLNKLSEGDQNFLKDFFDIKEPKAGEPTDSGRDLITEGLAQPIGEVSGPIDTENGSSYFVYIPTTLRENRLAPLMLYTASAGGTKGVVKRLIKGAELNGWVVASPVESKNGPGHPEKNHEHSKRCFDHIVSTLPIDKESIYFCGNSGGGAMAFYNANRMDCVGVMNFVGYMPDQDNSRKRYCYSAGGARDFNRYESARASDWVGKRGIHRFVEGGHTHGPDWIGIEGMVWLNGRYLAGKRKISKLDDERLDFENMLIRWMGELSEKTPYRAHYWGHFLLNDYEITGVNEKLVQPMMNELEKDPKNALYTEGIKDLDDFSGKYLARETSAKRLNKAIEGFTKKYAGVPEIEKLSIELGKPPIKP